MIVNSVNKIFDTCLCLIKDGFYFHKLTKVSVGHKLDEEKKIVGVLESGDEVGQERMI